MKTFTCPRKPAVQKLRSVPHTCVLVIVNLRNRPHFSGVKNPPEMLGEHEKSLQITIHRRVIYKLFENVKN